MLENHERPRKKDNNVHVGPHAKTKSIHAQRITTFMFDCNRQPVACSSKTSHFLAAALVIPTLEFTCMASDFSTFACCGGREGAPGPL